MQGLVSVIVPVYQVENDLDRCVASVVNQTWPRWELILVDDGSPDRCPQMCDDWAKKDSRIRVIHKENAGQGLARNDGIAAAAGEYLYFMDSDDYIAPETLEKCCTLAEKEQADVVSFGHFRLASDGRIRETRIPHPKKYRYEGREVQTEFLPNLIGPNLATGEVTNLWMSASATFCRSDVIRRADWKFVSEREIISEDYFSLLRLYHDVNCVAVVPEALYYYCDNEASFSRTYKEERFAMLNHFYDCCIRECEKLGYSEDVRRRIAHPYTSFTLGALMLIEGTGMSRAEKRKKMNRIFSDKTFRSVIAQMDMDKMKPARKLFFRAVQLRLYPLCRLFIKVKG